MAQTASSARAEIKYSSPGSSPCNGGIPATPGTAAITSKVAALIRFLIFLFPRWKHDIIPVYMLFSRRTSGSSPIFYDVDRVRVSLFDELLHHSCGVSLFFT